MLINFCDSEQLVASIDITQTVLTIFFRQHTAVELNAFGRFLEIKFQQYSLAVNIAFEGKNHLKKFHGLSSHLSNLSHMHFLFEKPITQQVMKTFIALLDLYQKDDNHIRKIREEAQHKHVANSTSEQEHIQYATSFYGEANKPYPQPIIIKSNIFKLWEEFTKVSPKEIYQFSSKDILNYFNNSLVRKKFKSQDYLPTPLELQNKTCSGINDIATRYANIDNQQNALPVPVESSNQYNDYFLAGLATTALLLLGLSFFRRWQTKTPVIKHEKKADSPAGSVITRSA